MRAEPAVAVVSFRPGPELRAVVEAIHAAAAAPVVVVVNDADPATIAALLAGLDGVAVDASRTNRGFAAGVNVGAARAFADGASHVLIANDDVELGPTTLADLVAAAGDGLAAVSPTIDAPGGDAFAGGRIDWRDGSGFHEPGARDFLTAAALLVPRAVWELVGPFDERLFLYYEDVDWSLRARARGVELRVAGTRVRHVGGAASGRTAGPTWFYYYTRNRLWLLERYRSRGAALRAAALLYRHPRTLLRAQPREHVVAMLRGTRDWLVRRMGQGPYPR